VFNDLVCPELVKLSAGMTEARKRALWAGFVAAMCGALVASVGENEAQLMVRRMPKLMSKVSAAMKRGSH
jgi:hypothetical protein